MEISETTQFLNASAKTPAELLERMISRVGFDSAILIGQGALNEHGLSLLNYSATNLEDAITAMISALSEGSSKAAFNQLLRHATFYEEVVSHLRPAQRGTPWDLVEDTHSVALLIQNGGVTI